MSVLNPPPHTPVTVRVAIVFCPDGTIWRRYLSLPLGSTLGQALNASGFFYDFPSITAESVSTGIYGKHMSLQHVLSDHDRIEIYSPLRVDPKIARRRRAAHREKIRHIKKKMPVTDLTCS